jgi:predicted Fe-S protein YdhL (DUF1289 family)
MEKSPCTKICKLVNNTCISCKRNINEIITWKNLSDDEKKKIKDNLKNR